MQRHCRTCDNWHDLDEPWPRACGSHFAVRSDGGSMPRPMVISDSLPDVQSMVSGERFDSKTQLRRHYKANGVTEVGSEIAATMKLAAQKPERPKIKRDDVRQAIAKVRAGYKPQLPREAPEL
jgi:hypothetical protein